MLNEPDSAPMVLLDEFKDWILHEDDHILVLNKPGWLVCHPSKNGPWSSLVGAAKEYLRLESIHLASRLDRETSGVVLFAKHRKAASHWQKAIEEKRVKRRYLAIIKGVLTEEVTVSNFLGNDPDSNVFVKQRVLEQKTNKAKKAETQFIPVLTKNEHTFCKVRTHTGRKHQIRAHAQWIGHPLVGEKLYGSDENIYLKFCEEGWKNEWMESLGMKRQALHGQWLGFEEEGGECFSAIMPDDMISYLQNELEVEGNELEALLK
ncbi:MAG: RNA pseudouridine synthase [Opitutales bacterium]|nr:RNA pseudouridine synthase [Opitutales bacterium]